jgi:hypothetical protein
MRPQDCSARDASAARRFGLRMSQGGGVAFRRSKKLLHSEIVSKLCTFSDRQKICSRKYDTEFQLSTPSSFQIGFFPILFFCMMKYKDSPAYRLFPYIQSLFSGSASAQPEKHRREKRWDFFISCDTSHIDCVFQA